MPSGACPALPLGVIAGPPGPREARPEDKLDPAIQFFGWYRLDRRVKPGDDN
jgi:hypothetical protein